MIELLFTTALIATIVGIAVPLTTEALDAHRTVSAARYLAGRINLARMEAVKRSTNVGIKFDPAAPDYVYAMYVDGNANGIRTLDIRSGVDASLTPLERIGDNFADVRFGLLPGVPDVDGGADTSGGDGVRIGAARILSLSANGTATAGTLYLHGRRQQFAVRVLGATGRTRVLQYRSGEKKWITR